MPPGLPPLIALRQRIDAVFARVLQLKSTDLELQADFAKYLCVLVSGYVEVAVWQVAIAHCEKRASPTVSSYAASRLGMLQNLKTERLLQLVGAFDPEWKVALEAYVAGRRKDALDSIVDLRNKIAHGESVSVTYNRVQEYYASIREIVDFVERKFS